VASYVAETGPRLEHLLAGLESFNARPPDQRQVADIDLAGLRARRDELAALPVAACLVALRDEEVALATGVIDQVAGLQAEGTPTGFGAGLALIGLLREVPVRVARIQDAQTRLKERYQVPEPGQTPLPMEAPPTEASAPP
jgi:hypothetical protein